ncbi:dihydrofolate reductase [Paenibacillus sambharensis]|uniref:Dihydrofolate reductase n=1 Tax=Paenibacillus sambharensis TaxID=1803190 RepID=A0A2W1LF66_9BACL|nr:dihydrofolate reductase [Paenibacillus sambharensis]PZD93685.1 dihydrofolate reductase [Paenibacillus sambharensis]
MTITMIAAMARNRVIGADNDLPWKLPDDMAFFKRTTLNTTVLMGRKTLESFHGPLKNRTNVVLTRNKDFHMEGCQVVHSVDEALHKYGSHDLMVIGGAEIYQQLLPHADTILLTEVDAEVEGDARFPDFPAEEWALTESAYHPADDRHAYSFHFNTYTRRSGKE